MQPGATLGLGTLAAGAFFLFGVNAGMEDQELTLAVGMVFFGVMVLCALWKLIAGIAVLALIGWLILSYRHLL